ncbi:MAG: metal ABC transporter permease [Nitrospiraceae bacterium]|nr:metal ABC transporter permease [Nitrospiraceae bacterium]
MGDAIAHAILPGIVIAYLLGLNILIGAFCMALLVAGAISFISRHQQLREDTAIGIVFTGAFALGIVLISRQQGYTRALTHFLIGNILGISPQDVWITVLVTLIVLGGLSLFFREWTLTAFDPTHARAIGLPMGALHFGLMVLLSLTIVKACKQWGSC